MKEIIEKNANITASSEQVEILKKNFPSCFDKHGKFMPEKLNALINEEVEITNESYELNWLGKKYARLLANQEVTTMLTEDLEHNSKPENINSENLYIEGDNLEVLKHMVNSYHESIKMIYIDPPYNTGTDFIYKDDRKFTVNELMNLARIDKEEATRILEFTESSSNSHSAWLTFMYPRLYIARELLKDDGVIFISIDDNEVTQLKQICDEIFGEVNFISQLVKKTKSGGGSDSRFIALEHEYVLCYAKNINNTQEMYTAHDEEYLKRYKEEDEVSKYFWDTLARPGLKNPIKYDIETPDGTLVNYGWIWSKERYLVEKEKGNIKIEKRNNRWSVKFKQRLNSKGKKPRSLMTNLGTTSDSKKDMAKYFDFPYFSYPKSVQYIEYLINILDLENEIVLDFFSGSSTTAQAVMNLNAQDNGDRKYIMVQIPEEINMKSNLIAYNFCKKELDAEPIISTIAKERIKRAASMIRKENQDKDYINDLDFGFKVFKTKPISTTNYFETLDKIDNSQTELLVTNDLDNQELSDLLLTWKLHDGIPFTKAFKELILDDYVVHYVDDKAYFMYKNFTNRNIIQLLEELDNLDNDFEVRDMIVYASNFTTKEQRELVEGVKTYKNKKKIELNVELRY